jgi:hypothetical protein
MVSCNHFGIPTYTFHFKILFRKISQQSAGITELVTWISLSLTHLSTTYISCT